MRLVVKHWDERLMKYAFAFQKALLTEILQFEPHAASWLQGMSWQFDLANTCAVTELPDSPFWLDAQVSLAQGVDETLTPENDTAQDLEKLFAIRDKELAH